MIEINPDGPFGNPQQSGGRLRVIGLGQAGIAALDQIVMYGLDQYDMVVADTDQQTIDGSIVKQKILLGAELTRGLGCGGDFELGADVAAASEKDLEEMVRDCDYLILSLGFGGATASLVAPQLVKEATKQNVRTLVIGTMPFGFESRRRQAQAMRTVAHLRRCADAVMVFANDRITALPEASGNIRQGFHVINQLTGHSIEAVAQILSKRGLIQLSFADIRSLYGCLTNHSVIENCWAGWSEVSDPADVNDLVEDLLASPLLQPEVWEQADHAVVCLSGGRDLSLVQVQRTLDQLQRHLPENFAVATGATLEEACKGKLRMTMLLARTKAPVGEEEPIEADAPNLLPKDTVPLPHIVAKKAVEPQPELVSDELDMDEEEENSSPRPMGVPASDVDVVIPRKGRSKKYIAKQEELQFDANHRGRFEKSIETIYEGENLDQPTFRRRKLQIRI